MRLFKSLLILSSASLLAITGCGGDDGDGGASCAGTDFTGATNVQYVVNTAELPETAGAALDLAIDLDGDDRGLKDNQLGMVIATLASQVPGLDLKETVDGAISAGDVILLVDLLSDDPNLTDGCGQMSVFIGANPNPAACTDENDTVCGRHLDGNGSFDIAPGSPTDTSVVGSLRGGQFLIGENDNPGNFSVELDFIEGQDPITLDLVGAQIEAQVSANGLTSGIIGGAIQSSDLETNILPTIKNLIDDVIEADCQLGPPECCTAGSNGKLIADIFDDNNDCTVSLAEIQNDPLISAFLLPDVDLLDASGNFSPNDDGVKESISVGLGFTTTTGSFTQ